MSVLLGTQNSIGTAVINNSVYVNTDAVTNMSPFNNYIIGGTLSSYTLNFPPLSESVSGKMYGIINGASTATTITINAPSGGGLILWNNNTYTTLNFLPGTSITFFDHGGGVINVVSTNAPFPQIQTITTNTTVNPGMNIIDTNGITVELPTTPTLGDIYHITGDDNSFGFSVSISLSSPTQNIIYNGSTISTGLTTATTLASISIQYTGNLFDVQGFLVTSVSPGAVFTAI